MSSASSICEIRRTGRDKTAREALYALMVDRGTVTAEEAAKELGYRLNSASTRLSELTRKGHAKVVGERINPSTGMKVSTYKAVPLELAIPQERLIFNASQIFSF